MFKFSTFKNARSSCIVGDKLSFSACWWYDKFDADFAYTFFVSNLFTSYSSSSAEIVNSILVKNRISILSSVREIVRTSVNIIQSLFS